MKELLILAATMATEEQLIDDIIENAEKVKILSDNKEYKHKLAIHCQLWLIRMITEGDSTKATNLMKKIIRQEDRDNMFDNINLQ